MEVDIPSEYLYLCGRWTEKYFNQKGFFFFIDLPISDEFGTVAMYQIASQYLQRWIEMLLLRLRSKGGPQSYLEDTFTAFSRSQPGLMHLLIRGLGS